MKATPLPFGGKVFCFLVIGYNGRDLKLVYNIMLTLNLIGRVSFFVRKIGFVTQRTVGPLVWLSLWLKLRASLMFEEVVSFGYFNFLLHASAERKGSVYNKNRNIPYRGLTQ
jgi:hypothetical protein